MFYMPRAAPLLSDHPLEDLRRHIARLEGPDTTGGRAGHLTFGIPAIDTHLGGGLAADALHEFAGDAGDTEHAAGATRLLALLLARSPQLRGPILWVCSRKDLYPPGLAATGLDPSRLIVVETAAAQVPAMMEEALRHGAPHGALAAVIGETSRPLGLTPSRRLHLAAGAAGRPALLLRRIHTDDIPNAAVTRWRIGALPGASPPPTGLNRLWLEAPRWRLDLLRCRGGRPASWTLTCHDDFLEAENPLPVAAALADRPPAPGCLPRRRLSA